MNEPEAFHRQNLISLIGGYATPLAIGLVGTALIYAPLPVEKLRFGTVLMLISLVFNVAAVPLASRMDDHSRGMFSKVRASMNLWINVVLVFLLGRVWPAIWLLFMLPAVAAAVYGSRQRTLVTTLFLSLILAIVNVVHGMNTPLEWGLVVSRCAFMVLTSLLINDLLRLNSTRAQ